MTGILSRKASTPFSGSSNPPAGRRQLSPSEYGAMVVAGLPPESNLEKLPSMLLKRWVLLLGQCAALASQFLTRMDPRPWPGPRLSRMSA